MAIYEFYCSQCHTVFNFISRRMNTDRHPSCPRCGRPELERQVSRFAVSRGQKEEPAETSMPEIDESKLERAMMSMAGELEGMNEEDPRQMARFMRRLSDAAGLRLGEGIEEAIGRLEAGEDPEKIEQEMGGLLDDESSMFSKEGIRGLRRRYAPPAHDEALYTLEES